MNQAVRNAFLEGSRRRGVTTGEVWNCVKWLRYYLDFCEKYRYETLDPDSLPAFVLKPASRNQSAEPQAQAARSVRLYPELARPAAPSAPAPTAPRHPPHRRRLIPNLDRP